jgi:GNAT superfamily N-acetyltransferase
MGMTARDAASARVRPFQPRDEAAVLELLPAAFGPWPRALQDAPRAEFFRWKTQRCPFGPSLSLVAEEEGQIIGFLAQLPWRLRAGEQTLTTLRGMDLAVHPDHRRRGVSLAIIRAAMGLQPPEVAVAWNNPNEFSRGGLLKVGRRGLVTLPRLARPGRGVARSLGRALARGSRTPEARVAEAPSAAEVLGDGEFVSALLERLPQPQDRLVTARSVEYLRWRYGHFDVYRALRLGSDPEAGGIAIFRLRRRGALWFADVCELLVARPSLACRLLGGVRRAAGADVLCCVLHSRALAARCGLVAQLGSIELTVRAIHDQLPLDPGLRSAWALSLGDVELL